MQQLFRRIILLVLAVVGTLFVLAAPRPLLAAPVAQTSDPSGDPVVSAAGDIAKCNREDDSYTGYLLDSTSGPILSIGDNAYESGTIQEFTDCYGPTWGRHFDRIYPVPGNHEYLTGGAAGYFTYFGDKATPLEPGCRKECGGYYSFNVGTWHVVALNSEISAAVGSEQEQWLRADLAANPTMCTLAFWHRPRYSSGYHKGGAGQELFQALYDYGGDIVLSGHDHDYERFAPQDPSAQYAPDRGVRQFVVGTGGDALRDYTFIQPNSEARNPETWGILKLTLHPTSYDWEFVPIPGQSFTDKGSSPCVSAPNVPTAPLAVVSTAGGSSAVDVGADTPSGITLVSAPGAAAVPAAGVDYTIQLGDTLGIIAAPYGLTWEVLAEANGLGAFSILEVGQVIRVPGADGAAAVVASPVLSTPVASTLVAAKPPSVAAAAATTPVTGSSYTVQAGDTLLDIALRNNVTTAEIASANGLSDTNLLLIGQVITIPGRAATTGLSLLPTATPAPALVAVAGSQRAITQTAPITTTAALTATAVASQSATSSITAVPAGARFYTVASGDTIITIALANNLDWQELLALNGLTPDSLLQIGQQIRLK